MYLTLAVLLGVAAITLTWIGLYLAADARRYQERLEALLFTAGPVDADVMDAYFTHPQNRLAQIVRPVATPLAALLPPPLRKRAREKLTTAGIIRVFGEAEFLLLTVVTGAAGVLSGVTFYGLLAGKNPLMALAGAAILIVIGGLLPDYVVQHQVNQRKSLVLKTLPDALDLILVSLEAGMGFDAAMSRVRDKFPGPIAEEFDRVLQEMRLGKPRAAALRDLAERTGLQEVSSFVSAVCMAEQLGVSLAQVLRAQSQSLRERRILTIREMAQKLPVKMLFPLVFCIFPAIFVVVVGSGVIRVYEALIK